MTDMRYAPIPDRENHHCFGCSPSNPAGLKMTFAFKDDRTICSTLSVPDHLCGWNTIVHGGVISTILDEIMSWSAIHLLKRIILTKSITVDFKKPILINTPLTAEGRVKTRLSEREALMEGKIINESGIVCAESSGVFALFSIDVARRLKLMDEAALEWFGIIGIRY